MSPARRSPDVTTTELIGGVERRAITLVEHDPAWAERFIVERGRIIDALGTIVIAVEHIGSTAVPGLAAKPIVDVLLTVADITDEASYVGPLVAAGLELRVRETGHRLLRTPERDVHVHVLEPDDPAATDYLVFRDRLRRSDSDRAAYERVKRELAGREWASMNDYADAKSEVVEAIKSRARMDRPQD